MSQLQNKWQFKFNLICTSVQPKKYFSILSLFIVKTLPHTDTHAKKQHLATQNDKDINNSSIDHKNDTKPQINSNENKTMYKQF